jgi:hypothetical protein
MGNFTKSIQCMNFIHFNAGTSWSSNKTPLLSSLSKQAGTAENAKALLSAPQPLLPSRKQVRDGQQCQGTYVRATVAATGVV